MGKRISTVVSSVSLRFRAISPTATKRGRMSKKIDDTATVRALMQVVGLVPDEAELAGFVAEFASVRAMVDSLYAVPDVRYEEPAVRFDARP